MSDPYISWQLAALLSGDAFVAAGSREGRAGGVGEAAQILLVLPIVGPVEAAGGRQAEPVAVLGGLVHLKVDEDGPVDALARIVAADFSAKLIKGDILIPMSTYRH